MRITANLSRMRKQRNLSLDEAAELTGVTKATLGQIERGEANPTVNTLWKIANGLKVSFSSLVEEQAPPVTVIGYNNLTPLVEEDGYRVYPVFAYDPDKRFEVFAASLAPDTFHASHGHLKGTEEYLLVHEGKLSLELGGEVYPVGKGDAIRFYSEFPHRYRNDGSASARFTIIIYYAE